MQGWTLLIDLLQRHKVFSPTSIAQIAKFAPLFHDLATALAKGDIAPLDLMGLVASRKPLRADTDLNAVPLIFRASLRMMHDLVSTSKMRLGFEGIPGVFDSAFHMSNVAERQLAKLVSEGSWAPAMLVAGFDYRWFEDHMVYGRALDGRLLSVDIRESSHLPEHFSAETPDQNSGLWLYYTGDFSPFLYNTFTANSNRGRPPHFDRRLVHVKLADVRKAVYFQLIHLFMTGEPLNQQLVVPTPDGKDTGFLVTCMQILGGGGGGGHGGSVERTYHYRIEVKWDHLYPGLRGSDSYLLPIVEFN